MSQRPHPHAGVPLHRQYSTQIDKPNPQVFILKGLLDHLVGGSNNQLKTRTTDIVSGAIGQH